MQSRNMNYLEGMNYGVGVNILTEQIAGKGITPGPITTVTNAAGQEVMHSFSLIESEEQFYEAFDVAAEAHGSYVGFSMSAQVKISESASFNSQSVYVVGRCTVENAFTQIEEARLEKQAAALIEQGKIDRFREKYGDVFVRGMRTGGVLYLVISLTNENTEEARNVAVDAQAELNRIVWEVGASTSIKKQKQQSWGRTTINVETYQLGGRGKDARPVNTVDAAIERIHNFPVIVDAAPAPFRGQVADYNLLDDYPEGPNEIDLLNKREVLQDCTRIRRRLLTHRNDVLFIQQHKEYYQNPPSNKVLNRWIESFTDNLNKLNKHASDCVDNVHECEFFTLKMPADFEIPERRAREHRPNTSTTTSRPKPKAIVARPKKPAKRTESKKQTKKTGRKHRPVAGKPANAKGKPASSSKSKPVASKSKPTS